MDLQDQWQVCPSRNVAASRDEIERHSRQRNSMLYMCPKQVYEHERLQTYDGIAVDLQEVYDTAIYAPMTILEPAHPCMFANDKLTECLLNWRRGPRAASLLTWGLKELNFLKSSSSNSKSKTSRLDSMRSGVTLLGMTETPYWMANLIRICIRNIICLTVRLEVRLESQTVLVDQNLNGEDKILPPLYDIDSHTRL